MLTTPTAVAVVRMLTRTWGDMAAKLVTLAVELVAGRSLRRRLRAGSADLLHHPEHRVPDVGGVPHNPVPQLFDRVQLGGRRVAVAAYHGARVTHPATARGGHPRDQAHERLRHVLRRPRRRLDLLPAADLADHHDHVSVVVVLEGLEHDPEVRPVDRVAADADARRLPEPQLRHLRHGLVVERAAPRDDPHATLRIDMRWHDPDLAFARRDDPGRVRPYDPGRPPGQVALRPDHV